MITPLYRKLFSLLLKKQLAKNFAAYCTGEGFTPEQVTKLISQNSVFYTAKLMGELERATAYLKNKIPWLDLVTWSFLVAMMTCAVAVSLRSYSAYALPIALACAMVAFGILAFLLAISTKMFDATLDEGGVRSPAASISVQVPLFLIQVLLGISLFMVGVLTLSASSLISGFAILAMSTITQYTAMSNFIFLFESRVLPHEEVREFLKATPGLYTRESKAWLLEEAMEGGSLRIGALQKLQSFEVEDSNLE